MAFKSNKRRKEYHREWYLKNRKKRLKQINDFRNKKRKRYYNKIVEYLKNHPCVDCKNTDIRVLEFDHLKDKVDCVMKMVKDLKPWIIIEKEISKCEIRCANCHKIKTYKNSFRDI